MTIDNPMHPLMPPPDRDDVNRFWLRALGESSLESLVCCAGFGVVIGNVTMLARSKELTTRGAIVRCESWLHVSVEGRELAARNRGCAYRRGVFGRCEVAS